MDKPRIYIETSVISYLTARPSRDLIVAAHQQITQDWWEHRQQQYSLYISQYVVDEAAQGDPAAAQKRLQAIEHLPEIDTSDSVEMLAKALIEHQALPQNSRLDALHLAVAAVNGIEILLTWNFKHLANAVAILKAESVCRQCGFEPPRIVTPLQMQGDTP